MNKNRLLTIDEVAESFYEEVVIGSILKFKDQCIKDGMSQEATNRLLNCFDITFFGLPEQSALSILKDYAPK